MSTMRKLLLPLLCCFILIETIFSQSDDDATELFFQEYCRADNTSLDEQFEKVINCRATEAVSI